MEDKRQQEIKEEKIGVAIANVTWYLFAIRLILTVSVIAAVPVYLMGKPLWIAPVIGFIAYFLYLTFWRLAWRIFWRFMDWTRHE